MTSPPGDPVPGNGLNSQQPTGQTPSGQPWVPPPIVGEAVSGKPALAQSNLDAWGRPLLEFDPATNRLTLARAAARLNTGLGVLFAVLLLTGVASALAVFFGGRAGLNALTSLGTSVTVPAYTDWLLALAALLTLAWSAVSLGLVSWARELLRRLATWALGSPQTAAQGAVRAEQLRRRLSGWLLFGQWGSVAGAMFGAALVPVTLGLVQRFSEQYVPTGSSDLGSLGPGLIAFQTVSSLVSAVPSVVIVWLILGSIRRFMNLAVGRARGLATAPVWPAAKLVGNWFVLPIILLGLGLLNLLGLTLVLAVFAGVGLGQIAPLDVSSVLLRSVLAWFIPLTSGFLVFGALICGLYLALLIFSRSYALSLGRLLDLGTQAAPGTPALPTGSAGENPNVYRGYQ